jgi:hypothetical protein
MKWMVVRLTAVLAPVLCLVGCGVFGTSGRQPGQVSAAPEASVASNRAAAQAEAARLLALTQVPPGASAADSTRWPASGPAWGLPGAQSLVDRSRQWQVNLPFVQTVAWLQAHPPAGLSLSGSTAEAGPGARTNGLEYDVPDSAAWVNGELAFSVASLTATISLVRADSLVIWLDPTPSKDQVPGRRIRVTVAGGCPSSDRHVAGVSNTGADLAARLVPATDPTAGLVCRYDGMNGRPFALTATSVLDAAAAGQVAQAAGRVRLAHVIATERHCPNGDEAVTVLALSYPGREDVDLWLARNGCQSLANGIITADAGDFTSTVTALHP